MLCSHLLVIVYKKTSKKKINQHHLLHDYFFFCKFFVQFSWKKFPYVHLLNLENNWEIKYLIESNCHKLNAKWNIIACFSNGWWIFCFIFLSIFQIWVSTLAAEMSISSSSYCWRLYIYFHNFVISRERFSFSNCTRSNGLFIMVMKK